MTSKFYKFFTKHLIEIVNLNQKEKVNETEDQVL